MRIDFVALMLLASLTHVACKEESSSDPIADDTHHPSVQTPVESPVVVPVVAQSSAPEAATEQPSTTTSTETQPIPVSQPVPLDLPTAGESSVVSGTTPVPTQPTTPGDISLAEQPVATQPVVTQPVATQPVATQPVPSTPLPPEAESSSTAAEPSPTALLAVFGDSISTGILADTRLGRGIGSRAGEIVAKMFSGDVTSRLEAQRALARPEVAAVSTMEPYGLRSSVARKKGLSVDQVDFVNLAQFGAVSGEIPLMLDQLKTVEGNLGKKADVIFMMLGSNDFCSDSSIDDFRSSYESGLAYLLKEHPEAHYILTPIPGIDQLAPIDYTYIPAFPGTSGAILSCNTLHKDYCPRVNAPDAAERLQSMNVVILEAAEKMKALVGAERVTSVTRLIDWQIQRDQLSFDCFHPSADGQRALGELIGEALLAP